MKLIENPKIFNCGNCSEWMGGKSKEGLCLNPPQMMTPRRHFFKHHKPDRGDELPELFKPESE